MTPAMQELVGLSMELGLDNRSADEKRRYVSSKQQVIHDGVHDALKKVADDFDIAFALIDTAKSMTTRDMLFRRRSGPTPAGASGTAILSMTRPQFADQYVRASANTALCSFYLAPSGEFWALVVQNLGSDRPLGKAALRITDEHTGKEFLSKLDSYACRRPGEPPNFDLQEELLRTIGSALIPFFVKMGVPRKLVFIPHRNLHLLPLHAMFVDTPKERLYLDGFVAEIVFDSCLTELLYGNVNVGMKGDSCPTKYRFLAALDVKAAGLSWIAVERDHFAMVRELGYRVDIVTCAAEIPSDFTPYALINWSGHAISNPYSWGQSQLSFDGLQISASTIASDWDLSARPIVTLAACEGAINEPMVELLDEYCGLDRAIRIAGARQVVGALWPIPDPLAALASIILPMWILQHQVSMAHALIIFQSNLRRRIWKQWLLTEHQLAKVAETSQSAARTLREIHAPFHKMDENQFEHPSCWSILRCYGG